MSYTSVVMDFCGFDELQQEAVLEAISLASCSIDVNNATSSREALFLYNDQLQACFITQGSERQQISDKIKDPQVRAQILTKLSFFLEEIGEGKDVSIKFILGASQATAEERLSHGITSGATEEVYLLGSERKLWPIHELMTTSFVAERLAVVQNIDIVKATIIVESKFSEIFVKAIEMRDNRENYTDKEFTDETNRCRAQATKHFTDLGIVWPTEADMMAKSSELYQKKYPDIMFKPVIEAKDKLENGVWKRANTTDTARQAWEDYGNELTIQAIDQDNFKLKIAIVTDQPYALSQSMQVKAGLKNAPIDIKIMAKGANPEKINASLLLGEVAKVIYICKDLDLSKLDAADTCVNELNNMSWF